MIVVLTQIRFVLASSEYLFNVFQDDGKNFKMQIKINFSMKKKENVRRERAAILVENWGKRR
jgi:hypothetical protein